MWLRRQSMSKLTTVVAILLTLWLNVAFAAHQVDLESSHHQHHQCELFSVAQQGLSHSSPLIFTPLTPFLFPNTEDVRSTARLYFPYLARSPPSLK
ncbi:DUF2607 family protein [Vibrio cortegadensis]|uniref:DUF2607 family protein n=2 Tax=Vibrio cortegadensis TaxID=1328770 RepID=UPI0036F1C9B6